jgi:hypothetical protein
MARVGSWNNRLCIGMQLAATKIYPLVCTERVEACSILRIFLQKVPLIQID